ncbi:unnamed protein product [Bursaphelenchus okinawaensis]|uniref:LsmAD domain-containing protein n=1 Tax=Bursaphelenchus okinawaensis TaxID=465554 RepID=A0A811KLC3_9BILA|nr:unnamed protein product [Bursaphelenchus okinawaensis]CAG9106113.1 unnamed protein product [Bursaphelenchus okinawaensis]
MTEVTQNLEEFNNLKNGVELQKAQHINAEATADLRRQLNRSESASSKEGSTKGEYTDLYPHTLDATGRDAKIYIHEGEVYDGIVENISPSMAVKIAYATKDNGDTTQLAKGQNLSLANGISVIKYKVEKPKSFRTDLDYNKDGKINETEELVEWQPDADIEASEDAEHNSRGWSVDEMFRANVRLGVKSTFEGVNEKYCTAVPEGDEEARRKAEAIAREIEASSDTQRHYMLENDDEERDLDKETQFRNKKNPANGYNSSRQQRNQGYDNNTNKGSNYSQRQGQSYASGQKYSAPGSRQFSGRNTGRPVVAGSWRQDPPANNEEYANVSSNGPRDIYAKPFVPRGEIVSTSEQHPTVEVQPIPKSPVQVKPESISSSTAPSPAVSTADQEEKKEKKKFSFNPNAKEFVPQLKPPAVTTPVGYVQPMQQIPRQPLIGTSVQQSQYQQINPNHYVNVQPTVIPMQQQVIPLQQSQLMMQHQGQYIPHQPPPQPQLIQTSLIQQHPQQQQFQLQQQQIPLMHHQQGRIQVAHSVAPGIDLQQNAHLQSQLGGQQMYISQPQLVPGVQPYQPAIPPPAVPQSMYNPNGMVYTYTPGTN